MTESGRQAIELHDTLKLFLSACSQLEILSDDSFDADPSTLDPATFRGLHAEFWSAEHDVQCRLANLPARLVDDPAKPPLDRWTTRFRRALATLRKAVATDFGDATEAQPLNVFLQWPVAFEADADEWYDTIHVTENAGEWKDAYEELRTALDDLKYLDADQGVPVDATATREPARPESPLQAVERLLAILRNCTATIDEFRQSHPACVHPERIAPGAVGVFNRAWLTEGCARAGVALSEFQDAASAVQRLPLGTIDQEKDPRPIAAELVELLAPGDDECIDGGILDCAERLTYGGLSAELLQATAGETAPATARQLEIDDQLQTRTPATINARMLESLQKTPDCHGWTVTQWCEHLKCSRAAVHKTDTWKELQNARERIASDHASTNRRRHTSGG